MRTREIISPGNTAVKEAVRLRRKRNRYERRRFLTEGEDLLAAALAGGYIPRQVFVLEGNVSTTMETIGDASDGMDVLEPDVEVCICSQPVMEKLSELGSGSRVIAVCDFIDRQLAAETAGPLIYLAGVGDPGNAGTIIRSASALGGCGVAFSPDAVDPYSFKCQRAAMGAVFRMPIHLDVTSNEMIAYATSRGLAIVSSDPHHGLAVWDSSVEESRLLAGDFLLVLGSERKGVPQKLMEASCLRLRIPQLPEAESLNVAMAGTVILYEALRQRQALP